MTLPYGIGRTLNSLLFVWTQRMVGGFPEWKRLWCVMRQHHMRCWTSPEEVGKRMPAHSMQVTKVSLNYNIVASVSYTSEIMYIPPTFYQSMVVEPAPRLSMRRPNALLLRDGKTEFFLAFESKEERALWMDTINQVYGWAPSVMSAIYSSHAQMYYKIQILVTCRPFLISRCGHHHVNLSSLFPTVSSTQSHPPKRGPSTHSLVSPAIPKQ